MVDIDELKLRSTLVLITLVTLQIRYESCGAMIKSLGSSGALEGDPAPGRSPGPPEDFTTLQGTSEQYPSAFLKAEEASGSCGFNTNTAITTNHLVDLKISHHLFKTDVLVPDIVYQVSVNRIISGNDIIEIHMLSSVQGISAGTFAKSEDAYNCAANELKSELTTQLTFNWSITHIRDRTLKTNMTFEINYRIKGTQDGYRMHIIRPTIDECQLWLKQDKATVTHRDLPRPLDCQVSFPHPDTEHGLVIELTRLNVPCSGGYLHFSGVNITHQHQQMRRRQTHICGKLEELPESERLIYLPSSHVPPSLHVRGSPSFSLNYRIVDHCYNMTFLARNGSFDLNPTSDLHCTFHIYLPYGYRIQLVLEVGGSTSTGMPDMDGRDDSSQGFAEKESECKGLLTRLVDGESKWIHCTRSGDAKKRIEMVSRGNKVTLQVSARSVEAVSLGLRMSYRAEAVEEINGLCGFGWIALKQFCISVVEGAKLPWAQAEMECRRRNGHLVSVRNEHAQHVINNMLQHSPGYVDQNAYWIGATDKSHNGDFRWSDGLPFSYSNWFPGWQEHGYYNRQPNDDGLSNQDCVEMRRMFSLPSSAAGLAPSFMWNDRDCATPNYFICERLQSNEHLEDSWPFDCNRSIVLSRQQPRTAIASPGFPRQYPDNTDCNVYITAPPGYRLILDFEELVLENEPSCSYDYLEIIEDVSNSSISGNVSSEDHRRLCGDWSSKLKLLRYISNGARLRVRFSSDYSHHFGGFKARVSIENTLQCEDDRLHLFNSACYLFVNYPEVTWSTAQKICEGLGANLASVLSPEEEKFITTNIRATSEYRTSAIYWLGAKKSEEANMQWVDGNELNYLGWLPGEKPEKFSNDMCLGMQWMVSPTPMLPSGLYWKFHKCTAVGGYVCKRPTILKSTDLNLNQTVNGTSGYLTTPNHPSKYYNNLDFFVKITGPENTRIAITFHKLDIENQPECLYDYVLLSSLDNYGGEVEDGLKVCGTHEKDLNKFNFVSNGNEALLKFHSDFSVSGSGFSLHWKAVDLSGCPKQTLTAKEGLLMSPNYPDFLLPHLDCSVTILAPPGKRIWLEIQDYSFHDGKDLSNVKTNESLLLISLDEKYSTFQPFQSSDLLSEGTYVSHEHFLQIQLKTKANPQGRGYRALYRTLDEQIREERAILLNNVTTGRVLHLNYPDKPAVNIDFQQHFSAPLGYLITVEIHNVTVSRGLCSDGQSSLEIYDTYADTNGTRWHLCFLTKENNFVRPPAPVVITSFLNSIHIRQINGDHGFLLNASLKIQDDPSYRSKLLRHKNDFIELCNVYPCLNEGKCVLNGTIQSCKCSHHFTGPFCAFTFCEVEPCIFGKCELTDTSFRCICKNGYTGTTCSKKRKPCEPNPCENKGTCTEKGNSYKCSCRAWWEGPRCEKKMQKIPYTPLTERMFHEPFWLGLMTVTIVMAVIGLVWCAKRHFPEKIEKLLAEDDRNRSTMSSLRSASVREQLAASGAAAITVTPSPGPGAPKSLFGRLGIRKPSILSLTSPHASGYVPATARTFSLDDLLKPPLRRTPSPKKKRNNSTPTKKNATEKKQILQQLISPAGNRQNNKKANLTEFMQLDERKTNDAETKQVDESGVEETKLSEKEYTQVPLNDPKMEKKVTFARLLSKVSAEMSSGSEIEMGIMQTNKLGYAFVRPASTPPSPVIDNKSPNSTCSNQTSGSFTSSDLAIPSTLSCSISDFLNSRRQNRSPGKQKPASADSILAMFRNYSANSVGVNLSSSLKVSPSTTPTASSPQDEAIPDDDSSTSSIHTPISFSSGAPESPVLQQRHCQSTIEVSVVDPFTAQKASAGGGNFLHPPTILLEIPSTISKCLSPIREMPTPLPSPLPSPALTPIMRRSTIAYTVKDTDSQDDRLSVDSPKLSITCRDPEDTEHGDLAVDPQGEDGLILEEAAVMRKSSGKLKNDNRPPPLGHCESPSTSQTCSGNETPLPLVIPTLTVQTPSPTHTRIPSVLFPGSPPPQRKLSQPDCSFKQTRKMLKEFDKPTSLDLPGIPPLITVTCNMSETESEAESASPALKASLNTSTAGMSYLSPFSIGGRTDHNASESNLSSSGYSSMASPGPSRCGSNNPLCPSEMEDPGSGSPYSQANKRTSLPFRNRFPSTSEGSENKGNEETRGRSDSETLSDDNLAESNDEGIGTDQLEEKNDDGELKESKEQEVFVVNDGNTKSTEKGLMSVAGNRPCIVTSCDNLLLDEGKDRLLPPSNNCKNSLLLPSIVVQYDSNSEKYLSPMSSRSESPLSDRTPGVDRFSSKFYGQHKDLLPFTDSDGLYDFPSSDKINVTSLSLQHKKSAGRKREKKLYRSSKTPSPTKSVTVNSFCHNLDIPTKDTFYKITSPRKPSPKRKIRPQIVSSSSSCESIVSANEVKPCGVKQETSKLSLELEYASNNKKQGCQHASEEEVGDEASSAMLPKSEELLKHPKISRLRTISHQIRFLRRLERSLKRRERVKSPSDSLDSDCDDDPPRVTSPLLQSLQISIENRQKSKGNKKQKGKGVKKKDIQSFSEEDRGKETEYGEPSKENWIRECRK